MSRPGMPRTIASSKVVGANHLRCATQRHVTHLVVLWVGLWHYSAPEFPLLRLAHRRDWCQEVYQGQYIPHAVPSALRSSWNRNLQNIFQ